MSSGSTTETKQNQTNNPWAVQIPYLTDAFSKAQGQVNSGYTGDRVAQFTPDQLATFQRMVGAGNNPAAQNIGATSDQLMTGGANATTGALSRLGAFNPAGGTQSNIDAANSYADAAVSPGAIDAVMRDARRSVSEGALPQIARNSAVTGNTMSSRRAISEGLVERGLAEKTADVSAGMRSDAFGKGLSLAEGGRQFDNNAMLDALKASGSIGAGASEAGISGANSGVDTLGKLFQLATAGGAGQQAATQAGYDNSIAKSGSVWDDLAKYYGIVGGNNWGGTQSGTGTSTKNPSIWEIAGGLMSAGGSLLKSDRRVKHDVTRVGYADNGLPIYTFRYNDDPENLVVGVMAQDVEVVKPAAVYTIDGIKHVDIKHALGE